jgi:hypothetical protein
MEVRCQGVNHENQNKEVEGVKRPAQKAGHDGVPLVGARGHGTRVRGGVQVCLIFQS